MRIAIASLLFLLPSIIFAEEPKIRIVKSTKMNIAITGLSGGDLDTLKHDLANSGFFTITGADQAQFTAGASDSGGLHGTVTAKDGAVPLS